MRLSPSHAVLYACCPGLLPAWTSGCGATSAAGPAKIYLYPRTQSYCSTPAPQLPNLRAPNAALPPLAPGMLPQAAVDPRFMLLFQQLGRTAELHCWDASELAGVNEELTYCQLQVRALRARQASVTHAQRRRWRWTTAACGCWGHGFGWRSAPSNCPASGI